MKIYQIVNRYYLIITKIKDSHYLGFDVIQEHLAENGISISLRTLQRDLQNIRNEFGIEVIYNKVQNGYALNSEASSDFEYFMRFFEITVMSGQLTENFKNNPGLKDVIIFDNSSLKSGLAYINPILSAIQEQNKIDIHYSEEFEEFDKNIVLAPTLLKEYKNSWHLIAWNTSLKKYQNYELGNIKALKIRTDKFDPSLIEECKGLYSYIIGVNQTNDKPEIIELSFNPQLSKIIKQKPLHHTQSVLSENDDELRILIKVIPNDELTDLILSYRKDVEVINPIWLKEEFK